MKFLNLIRERGYTCVGLARELGVSRQSIYHWDCCKSTPNPKAILQMSEILNVPIEKVLKSFIYDEKEIDQ